MKAAASQDLLMLLPVATEDELLELWGATKGALPTGEKYAGLLLAATTVSGIQLLAIMRSGAPEADALRDAHGHARGVCDAMEKLLTLMLEAEARIGAAMIDPSIPPTFPKI